MPRGSPGQRREQILQTFATMLESRPGSRITTAALAQEVGVSEAALYRHFPSKARMFEGLIEFIEETVFSRTPRVLAESEDPRARCRGVLLLLLSFCERNPGFSRLITGDALAGETDRLRRRMAQFHDRVETELRTILREGEITVGIRSTVPANIAANTMLALAEGRIAQFVRSEFRRAPTEHFEVEWSMLAGALFTEAK
ncbi:MAG: nucleoid occlusion factor SlmA [Pseudomonadales bacterium]|nr:nucleoid occlusion factor SlmA [Pseudomonadales bacterium]MEE2892346.1 nucleoid occlusion factor SlmA [Pseudomonadota bacterium]